MTASSITIRRRGIAALVVCALLIGVWPVSRAVFRAFDRWRVNRALQGHVSVIDEELAALRPSEARIVTTAAYVAVQRDGSSAGRLSPRARIASASLETRPALTDPDALAAVAATRLVEGNPAAAIAILQPRLADDLGSARLAVTLSAAYYMRRGAGDLVRAFDVASRFAPRFADDALKFNRALAGGSVLPGPEAISLWEAYAKQAADPGWRQEAALRAQALRSSRAAVLPSGLDAGAIRSALYDAGLEAAAAACQGGSVSARQQRRAQLAAGAARLQQAGDRYFRDLTRRLFRTDSSAGCDAAMADQLSRFGEARGMYRRDQRDASVARFERLLPALEKSASPLALEARLYLATSRYFTPARRSVSAELDRLRDQTAKHRYLHLLARTLWMQGYILQDQGHFESALRSYQEAERAYRDAGDLDGLAAVQSVLSTLFDSLGDYPTGWQKRDEALAHISRVLDPRARYSTLSEAARAAARDGLFSAGLHFAGAAVTAARDSQSDLRVVEASIERARLELSTNQRDRAARTLDAAEQLAASGASTIGPRTQAAVLLARSEMAGDESGRLALVNRALDLYRGSGADIVLARLLLGRARAHRAIGDSASAEADYLEGISVFERLRAELADPSRRISYFEEAWSLFDDAIALRVEDGRLPGALHLAMQARAGEWRGRLAAASGAGIQVGPDSRLLFYVVLEDKTVVWVFGPGTVTARTLPAPRLTIERLSRAFREDLVRGASVDRLQRHGGELYERLVAPIVDLIPAGTHLGVVPDPLLQSVPMAAFWHAASARYLIEEHELTLLPAVPARWPRNSGAAPHRALVLGDPSRTQGRDAPRLPSLPGAEGEARRVAALYGTRTLLLGSEATREAFLQHAPHHEIIHFAGHAVLNPEVPAMSRLVLADSRGDEGAIYQFELGRRRFDRTSVVVLAACDTAAGRTYRSEGVVSLARGFLYAGVPDVVATLWKIGDDASAALFVAFHGRLRQGEPPSRALRAVQLASLTAADPAVRSPSAWGAIVSISNPLPQIRRTEWP